MSDIQQLVDNGPNSQLTIRLKDGQDEISLPPNGVLVGDGKYEFFSDANLTSKVATLVVEYA